MPPFTPALVTTASVETTPSSRASEAEHHKYRVAKSRRAVLHGGGRAWSEYEEDFLIRTRNQKVPYKQIAAKLKKTELACRLHYHQLTNGAARRKREMSEPIASTEHSPVLPSSSSAIFSRNTPPTRPVSMIETSAHISSQLYPQHQQHHEQGRYNFHQHQNHHNHPQNNHYQPQQQTPPQHTYHHQQQQTSQSQPQRHLARSESPPAIHRSGMSPPQPQLLSQYSQSHPQRQQQQSQTGSMLQSPQPPARTAAPITPPVRFVLPHPSSSSSSGPGAITNTATSNSTSSATTSSIPTPSLSSSTLPKGVPPTSTPPPRLAPIATHPTMPHPGPTLPSIKSSEDNPTSPLASIGYSSRSFTSEPSEASEAKGEGPHRRHYQRSSVDISRLSYIYESHRSNFWSTIAREYGQNVQPDVLEHVWKATSASTTPETKQNQAEHAPNGSISSEQYAPNGSISSEQYSYHHRQYTYHSDEEAKNSSNTVHIRHQSATPPINNPPSLTNSSSSSSSSYHNNNNNNHHGSDLLTISKSASSSPRSMPSVLGPSTDCADVSMADDNQSTSSFSSSSTTRKDMTRIHALVHEEDDHHHHHYHQQQQQSQRSGDRHRTLLHAQEPAAPPSRPRPATMIW